MPQLIKQVENQLLLSQLSTSTISTLSLLPHPLPDRPTTLFPTKAASVLLQVMAIEEIAQPALSLLRILKERQQLDKLRLANEGIDDAEKERRRARREGAEEDEAGEGEWVRGVMKFELSDGHNSVKGVEWKRIPGFSLEETKLGCKVSLVITAVYEECLANQVDFDLRY
jgi:RecQ-mediated genome instability protein 1